MYTIHCIWFRTLVSIGRRSVFFFWYKYFQKYLYIYFNLASPPSVLITRVSHTDGIVFIITVMNWPTTTTTKKSKTNIHSYYYEIGQVKCSPQVVDFQDLSIRRPHTVVNLLNISILFTLNLITCVVSSLELSKLPDQVDVCVVV